jgi:nucleotide-binding universal stress UspA family protein
MAQDEGFVPLFNGRDLAGWKGLVENPIARATLSPADIAAKQVQADAKAKTTWSVRDGAIVFNGKGDNLCTVRDYGDFEMVVDWRITKDGDSGIYLRGSPQVQIWDPARTDVGAEVGSGGLYNNQKNPSKPLVFADNPVGEWNTFRIRMVGDTVTVFLNGIKVVDQVTMENYWDRKQPIFPRGAIELQAHGTDLAFRDIYVRELDPRSAELSPDESAQGFVPLFNGRDLDGWIGNRTGYKADDGVLVFDPTAGDRSNIYTAKEYADFQFRFEFQLTPGANSGVGIRAPREGDAAYVGMEIQVLDDTAPVYAELQPYQYHGSVYGIIPAKRGALKPVGEWNAEEIKKGLQEFCKITEVKIGSPCVDLVSKVLVPVGHPVEEILKAADDEGCDAIILGTHGKGFLRQTFLGSVSVSVLERTRKPVFIIPLPSEKTNIDWDNM